jgi:hypothetical protein
MRKKGLSIDTTFDPYWFSMDNTFKYTIFTCEKLASAAAVAFTLSAGYSPRLLHVLNSIEYQKNSRDLRGEKNKP